LRPPLSPLFPYTTLFRSPVSRRSPGSSRSSIRRWVAKKRVVTVRRNDRSSGAARGAALLSVCWAAFTADTRAQVVEHPIATDPTRIDSGLVAGAQLSSGVRAYFGIPYAAPPLRALRGSEPKPANSRSGLYHVDRQPPACMRHHG